MKAPSKLFIHKDSHTISKQKPKIRIIHIVAPEIIKTDVDHFRELVQRLTGKPLEMRGRNMKQQQPKTNDTNTRKNIQSAVVNRQRMKRKSDEGENQNSFLNFLGDVDGFIRDMNEFPLLSFRSSQINTFGEMPLC